jgi:MFS family permease
MAEKGSSRSSWSLVHPTVVALGIVSFLTDSSADMIMPYLPNLLTAIGGGAFALGLIEGAAEATVALWRLTSGLWADRVHGRKPLVVLGYGLSSLVRPLVGFSQTWPVVLAIRLLDRAGKGIRGVSRDALIADVTEPSLRGTAFGFHRSFDHAGALVGPAVAALLLMAGLSLRQMFLASAVPAAAVMLFLIFRVQEPERHGAIQTRKLGNWAQAWRQFDWDFKKLLFITLIFTLGESTDLFLVLRLSDAGLPLAWQGFLWAGHHGIKMLATYHGGRWSDRIPRRWAMILGWLVYALAYLGFGMTKSLPLLALIFLFYGLYYGLVEPAEKAWVTDMAPAHLRGTALGLYDGLIGMAALPASLVFGLLWKFFGAPTAFYTGAGLAGAACLGLVVGLHASSAKGRLG